MAVMGEFRKPYMRVVFALSVLVLAAGCSRSLRVPDGGSNQAGQAPFRTTATADGALPTARQGADPEEAGLPFQDGQSIPAGTLLTVRLQGALTSAAAGGNDRLALQSVHLAGVDFPVQTASLFARQVPSADSQPSTVRLEDGRRLTFRVMEPIALHPHPTRASR